jgi:Domain of unknown function (DUF4185)
MTQLISNHLTSKSALPVKALRDGAAIDRKFAVGFHERQEQHIVLTKQITHLVIAVTIFLVAASIFQASASSPTHRTASSSTNGLTDGSGGEQAGSSKHRANASTGSMSDATSAPPLGVKDVAAVMPLTGETLQLYVNGIYYKDPTPNRTATNFGVFGTDEGYPVQVGNQIIFFFGDTQGVVHGSNGEFVRYPGHHGEDSIAYMPNQSLANCHYIPGLISQLESGNRNPSPDTKGCPLLSFYTNSAHTASQPAFQPIIINGLTGSEGTGASETPVGSLYFNGYLYMFYADMIQPTGKGPHSNFHLETILAKSTKPVASFSPKNPPVFEKLYVASSHPPIAEPASPPNESTGVGKFIRLAPIVFSHSALVANGMLGGLPQELQNAQQVILLFGASWKNHSNLYLAALDAGKIESGPGAWWYLTNTSGDASGWSHDESSAQPLFSNWNISRNPSIAGHGVSWSDELHKFILLYAHNRGSATGGVVARFSSLPWGPWSEEVSVLGTEDTLAKQIYHHEGDPITSNNTPRYSRKGKPIEISDTSAGFYGPYFIGPYDVNKDGSVTYYFTLSPFVPYEVFLMKTTFCATSSCK